MIQLDTSALKAIRSRESRKKIWEPLRLSTLHEGLYLAADPSLSAFGLVLFEVLSDQRYAVHMAEIFKTSEMATGWEDIYQRTLRMQVKLAVWIRTWIEGPDWGRFCAVHEAPPVGGGRIRRIESTSFGGYAYRAALQRVYPTAGSLGAPSPVKLLPMVRRQDHARLICGDPNADKKVHHAALKEHFDAIRDADELITNEHTRDALSVALFAAHRGV